MSNALAILDERIAVEREGRNLPVQLHIIRYEVVELLAFKAAAEYMLAGRPDELRAIREHADGLAPGIARNG